MVLQNFDVFVESHIKHLIALVKDLKLALAEIKSIVLAQVNKSTRSSDKDLWLTSSNFRHYKQKKLKNQKKLTLLTSSSITTVDKNGS